MKRVPTVIITLRVLILKVVSAVNAIRVTMAMDTAAEMLTSVDKTAKSVVVIPIALTPTKALAVHAVTDINHKQIMEQTVLT